MSGFVVKSLEIKKFNYESAYIEINSFQAIPRQGKMYGHIRIYPSKDEADNDMESDLSDARQVIEADYVPDCDPLSGLYIAAKEVFSKIATIEE